MTATLFDMGGSMFISGCTFIRSGLTPYLEIISPKKYSVGAPEKTFISVKLQVGLSAYF